MATFSAITSVIFAPSLKPSLSNNVAKPETVQKVCEIVRRQLALPAETELTSESKFSALGADSLDTVEIVMSLEEEFGIGVEEENSQNITTVQEAADLIEKLVEKKAAYADAICSVNLALIIAANNNHVTNSQFIEENIEVQEIVAVKLIRGDLGGESKSLVLSLERLP
ncbi:Acyl carrier protein 4 [Citrus sinensis]|uniref:Acyl carrier protein 4 n=1 Tax=Citrus sinensis TaxID=2711 RepID=A0ACB8LLY2_CITSI|nr:Acyl carrier protein 4 [Citrus sinensis]